MQENNIGSVVITKRREEAENVAEAKAGTEPVGIITERDIVNKIALKLDPASYRSLCTELFASKIIVLHSLRFFQMAQLGIRWTLCFKKTSENLQ